MSKESSAHIPGYGFLDQIYESHCSRVYRGVRQRDDKPVVLKVLREDYPSAEEIIRYKQEHRVTSMLGHLPGVIAVYGLESFQNTLMIVLEDFGAVSFDKLAWYSRFSLHQLIGIASRIVEALGRIHACKVIHKDVNPSNIVYNTATDELKIIDFGISTLLSSEIPILRNPEVLEGTLAYISPEQTGRMNRSVDYRTDYYSLGITLYELFSGRLPYESTDALELVHCHIAREPIPLQEANPQIPQALCDTVMKLLAKNAEDRYQSALGIKRDLDTCLSQLQASGGIVPFPLAEADIPERFQIPEKLYGREREVELLMSAFERVRTGQKQMMLVSGSPGIGKTSLLREIYKPVTEHRGCFISGKFDQFQRNIPYAAVVSAFRDLVRQLLGESEDKLDLWRQRLLNALCQNGQLMVGVIPELELIVGPQPALQEVGPVEAQERFSLVFKEFIRVFCRREHPLVIFLDDLQWSDSASLRLIELMMTDDETEFLLILGAYRDSEVTPSHRLMIELEDLKARGATVDEISLGPLNHHHITALTSETLHKPHESVGPLCELVYGKTAGNPFFVNEFLSSLNEERLLRFEGSEGGWYWNLEQIRTRAITDNVVELLAEKMRKLNSKPRDLLKLAACMGNQFDLATLAMVNEKPVSETLESLWPAVDEGFVIPLGDAWKPIALDVPELEQGTRVEFKFAHDRIQQAAYWLVPEADRAALHGNLGRRLLRGIPSHQLEERVFDVVDQLNRAMETIQSDSDRRQLAQLNLMAGKKAKASAALQPAYEYLHTGLKLLEDIGWDHEYDLILELHSEAAEAAFLCTEFEETERLVATVFQNARVALHSVKAYEVAILAAFAQGAHDEALQIALRALERLGERLPKNATKYTVLWDLAKTKLLLAGKGMDHFLGLPRMTDPTKRAVVRILTSAGSSAYGSSAEYLALLLLRMVTLSVTYGNAPSSHLCYAGYALILCAVTGDIEAGYRFGQMVLKLLDDPVSTEDRARAFYVTTALVRHWKEPARTLIDSYRKVHDMALNDGDLEYVAHSLLARVLNRFAIGDPLSEVEQEIEKSLQEVIQFKQHSHMNSLRIYRQTVFNLMDESGDPCALAGPFYDEETGEPLLLELNVRDALFKLYFLRTTLNMFFERYEKAIDAAEMAEQYEHAALGLIEIPALTFYDSLARLGLYDGATPHEKASVRKRVRANLKKLRNWAHHAPMNHLHRLQLVEAERSRALGRSDRAIQQYQRAIDSAHRNGFIHDQALALEFAGKFLVAEGDPRAAVGYLLESRYCYERWGAAAKVKDIDEKYAHVLGLTSRATRETSITSQTTAEIRTSTDTLSELDLTSVSKASQAISSEIVLEKLLDKLMRIVVESAGAQKGFLILESNGKLHIEAHVETQSKQGTVLQSLPIDDASKLSPALVSYVARTKQSVVLNDAAEEGGFTHDPYVKANKPRSIMCAPLIHQGELSGILYLENNLTAGAFTPQRLEMLRLMCSQAAISLENARLYEQVEDYSRTLEEKVSTRTRELERANQELRREVAERERAEDAAREAKSAAEQANRAKSDFLANMSHELRTPLNSIIGFSELLEDQIYGQLNDNQGKFAQNILESGRHLLLLINEILDLSKVESGKVVLQPAEIDLTHVLESCLLMVGEKASRHSLQITLCVEDDLQNVRITVDELRFKQIVFNLLSNATKFTADNGTIRVHARRDGNELIISVSDTGTGISPEDQERIFEPFEQAEPCPGWSSEGTGLGLPLCKRLVELHGGRIWVESEGNGKGSTFTFAIPV